MRDTSFLAAVKAVASALLAITALAGAARADGSPLPIEVGGFIGYHVFSDSNKLGRSHNDPIDNALNDAPAIGVRAGYNVIPRLALEAELGLVPTGVHGQTEKVVSGGSANTEPYKPAVLGFALRAHAILHLATGAVRPFLLAGGGMMTSVSSNSAVVAQDTDVMFHVGAGLKADIADDWGLRVDLRVYFPPDTHYALVTEDYEILLALYGRFGRAR